MSHIPNFSFREILALGSTGTTGVRDFASPDNTFVAPRTPGPVDRCTIADVGNDEGVTRYASPEDLWRIMMTGVVAGPALMAAQAYSLPAAVGTPPKLTQKDFELAAAELKCEIAAVKAVAEVEARGSGFLADGRPKILFEAHHFSRLTDRVYDKLNPSISSSKWKKDLYKGGVKEYDRLEEALELDAWAAIQAASWGAFQIMGFNFTAAGFSSPEDFVASMYTSEGAHLAAFIAFVQSMKLAKHIQKKDWESFAKGYNGPKYKDNDYDGKLAKAYAKHAKPAVMPGAKPATPGGPGTPGTPGAPGAPGAPKITP